MMRRRPRHKVRWQYGSLPPEEKWRRQAAYKRSLPTAFCTHLAADSLMELEEQACLPIPKLPQAIAMARQRLLASKKAAFVEPSINQMAHYTFPGLPTVCVNRLPEGARVVWGPDFLSELSVECTAYAVAHEAAHIALDTDVTAMKCHGMDATDEQRHALNVAADLEIEQLLSDLRDIRLDRVYKLGGFCPMLWIKLNFEEGKDTYYYYNEMKHRLPYYDMPLKVARAMLQNENKSK